MPEKVQNQQLCLKPQDLIVSLAICLERDRNFTYAELGEILVISPSAAHAAVRRAEAAGLIRIQMGELKPNRTGLKEFVVHGLKYAFPATLGTLARGIPTSASSPLLKSYFAESSELPLVWPSAEGSVRGISIFPLYPSVPEMVKGSKKMYEILSLLDAIRAGNAREREIAIQLLGKFNL